MGRKFHVIMSLRGCVECICQPFNAGYEWFNTSDNLIIPNPAITVQNSYTGGVYQQASSGVTQTNQQCYELTGQCFSVYAFEYQPGRRGRECGISQI